MTAVSAVIRLYIEHVRTFDGRVNEWLPSPTELSSGDKIVIGSDLPVLYLSMVFDMWRLFVGLYSRSWRELTW